MSAAAVEHPHGKTNISSSTPPKIEEKVLANEVRLLGRDANSNV
jgi:hypothetical protein